MRIFFFKGLVSLEDLSNFLYSESGQLKKYDSGEISFDDDLGLQGLFSTGCNGEEWSISRCIGLILGLERRLGLELQLGLVLRLRLIMG